MKRSWTSWDARERNIPTTTSMWVRDLTLCWLLLLLMVWTPRILLYHHSIHVLHSLNSSTTLLESSLQTLLMWPLWLSYQASHENLIRCRSRQHQHDVVKLVKIAIAIASSSLECSKLSRSSRGRSRRCCPTIPPIFCRSRKIVPTTTTFVYCLRTTSTILIKVAFFVDQSTVLS